MLLSQKEIDNALKIKLIYTNNSLQNKDLTIIGMNRMAYLCVKYRRKPFVKIKTAPL